MARPTLITHENAARAAQLRAQGLTVKELAAELRLSQRTAYKLLDFAGASGAARAFEPWTLLSAADEGDLPDRVRWLIESGLQWQRSTARLAWLVHRLRPELPPLFVLAYVAQYRWVAADPRNSWQTKVFQRALLASPWLSIEAAVRFYQLVAPEIGTDERRLETVSGIDLALRRAWRAVSGDHAARERPKMPVLTGIPSGLRPHVHTLLMKRVEDDRRIPERVSEVVVRGRLPPLDAGDRTS